MPLPPSQMKKRYAERKQAGLCVRCGAPSYGMVLCPEHHKYNLQKCRSLNWRRRERYDLRKSQGLCTECQQSLPNNAAHSICQACHAKRTAYLASRRDEMRAALVKLAVAQYGGRCVDCGCTESLDVVHEDRDWSSMTAGQLNDYCVRGWPPGPFPLCPACI